MCKTLMGYSENSYRGGGCKMFESLFYPGKFVKKKVTLWREAGKVPFGTRIAC